jgi:predicted deacetylase
MRKACCIYRIDDITPGMNWGKFYKFLGLFQKYHVVPLIGVVPDNKDPNLTVQKEEAAFWKIIKRLKDEGKIEVSQHGYQHKYITDNIQPFHRFCGFKPQSEFYGLSYMIQYEKIKAGKEIFERNGIEVDTWMAPGHSFDRNTIKALRKLRFRAVTDGIGLFPVKKKEMTFVPQQLWGPEKSYIGVKTICLHLNSADDEMYHRVEEHLKSDSGIVPFSSVLNYEAPNHIFLNHLYKGVFVFNLIKNKMRNFIQNE